MKIVHVTDSRLGCRGVLAPDQYIASYFVTTHWPPLF